MANPDAALAGQPAEINNPGSLVSMRAVTNLKLACFYIRHRDRTSRATALDYVILARIRELRDLRDQEASHVEPKVLPVIEGKDWPKILESIIEWLGEHKRRKEFLFPTY